MDSFKSNDQYFEASFKKLERTDSHYTGIEFEECQFSDCDFSEVRFKSCKFINCEFIRCNLSLMDLSNTRLFGMTFKECKLVGVDWTKAIWPAYHLDFELKFDCCVLNDSSFFGLTLNELILSECKLHDVDFREGDFCESTMNFCDFSHSLFMRTNLRNVDFSDSTGYVINVLENQVSGAKFSRYEALSLLESLGIELVD
ncbi:hypothetical protein DI392_15880 [Vibrio albus]|uniref:Pentapeptide repeat-containing protein n=1 Tax=Vibrio albus TaxID=2200953 RepID=A0A2U3B6Y1_9VIBR|nr:pentapeptide repeat-containing protein [Vibrio albus]PWI32551.1 hypothetical protein DI392_15880 [Vibrio albus]